MKQTGRGCATSELAIDIKRTFDNVHKGVLLKTMLDLDLPEASRCCMNYFMSRRGNSLIIDSEVKKLRRVDSGIPYSSSISLLLFLIYMNFLYNKIRETGAHLVDFIDSITT